VRWGQDVLKEPSKQTLLWVSFACLHDEMAIKFEPAILCPDLCFCFAAPAQLKV